MPLSESLAAQAQRELFSTQCPACGREKKSRKTFCYPCFALLSRNLSIALDRTSSSEFANAYDEAKTYLRVEKGVEKK